MELIGSILFYVLLFGGILVAALALLSKSAGLRHQHEDPIAPKEVLREQMHEMTSQELDSLLDLLKKGKKSSGSQGSFPGKSASALMLIVLSLLSVPALAQSTTQPSSLLGEAGIIITIFLLLIPVLGGLLIMILRLNRLKAQYRDKRHMAEAGALAKYLKGLPEDEAAQILAKRKEELDFKLSNQELSGTEQVKDSKGLIQNGQPAGLPFVTMKKRADKRPKVDPQLSKLVLWYLGCATFWLLFGTTIGEYLGIKFVAPDADHVSWLSFGRLRPVHTNAVFWGWASLAMIGLANYAVPIVSNVKLASYKMAWWTLGLINAAVILGSLSLMAGINNGGGEYREYIWPIMALFATGLVLTLINYLKTIARRTTKEIYVSNWYIVSSIIFTIVIALVAYLPFWQNGLGETIAQGYYMHQGVGMWFMLFTLGLVYYYLPQQLNKPIYSYSLGILAFWAQILFYTLIGSHHFVFSPIPWWLQTVAIVGSMGMAIPVIAGTTNFLMTFKGGWYKLGTSYTLPFFLVGTIFYFTGSLQGTAEAFRTTNLYWHFTDFTVAHSHLTMYGIITFFMWAGAYAIVPRLTGQEPKQALVGAHFWLALIGLMFYTVPLMYGSTIRGMMWMEAKPFIDTVSYMAQHWLWRAIGGSLMWISHVIFAYNMYKMYTPHKEVNVRQMAIVALAQETEINKEN
ncbi:MAG: cbb3-type cytochrome c oxidase subunit I [Bacteroidetes bacterium]|nr:cbb3-type cytochrome c oxidase subunit I [Bacteroidota bacterium]MBS1630625.1 cbb3-type cytochrome c oxidase subunit I [Bacteroidota bacterium]